LRNSIEILKNNNKIKYIRQYVTADDWTNILNGKTSWKMLHFDRNTGIYFIECIIEDILQNMATALGVIL
jgi:hypothetical protein